MARAIPLPCVMLPAMIERIREILSSRQDAMLEQIERLVLVNSFTENTEGGDLVAVMLSELLQSIPGVLVNLVSSERYASHVIAKTRAAESSSEGAIAIVGHLDTVFPPGTFEGFRCEDGIARGPGVLDMKGGLVVAIEALRALAEVGLLEKLPVRFVIVSEEEVGSPESQPMLQRELTGASCALVLESGRKNDMIITARKGTGSAKVTATGKAAHAGNAHKQGANAIWALSRFVDEAQRLTDYDRGITVNVGKISGGQSKNTVPDHAEALTDFRFEHIDTRMEILNSFAEAAKRAVEGVPGTNIVVASGAGRMPLERTEANVTLYREYAVCAREAGLGDGEAPLIGGGSDASTTSAIGIPSIDGLGPRGTGFHTKDELIEVSSLVPKALAMALFLAKRAG